MSSTGWKIRFYDPMDFNKTKDVVGNYKRWGSRFEDDVFTFCGMYGIGDYLVWYMKKDIGYYDFGKFNLDLSLYIGGKTFFQRQYAAKDVRYDGKEKRYVLYAISKDTQLLNTPLVDYDIQSLAYDKNRTPEQVLKEVLEGNNILKVQFESHPTKSIDYEYRQLTFNLQDTVYDFIRYVADDSGYEWFVRNKVLYIGKELHIRQEMRSTTQSFDITENDSQTSNFKKISGKSRPMDILSHLEESWKCVWAKHAAGRCGGLSKGCFTRRGSGQINKKIYYQSLEGRIERELGIRLLERNPHIYTSSYVGIGNIIKDEGNTGFIDQVSVQRNINAFNVRTPRDVKIDRNETTSLDTIVKHMKEETSRSTPYADKDAGIFFPSPKLTDAPPNVLIHNIDGREEASVIGNYILGNGRDITFPLKNKGDFRLQFPNGWCLLVKENGDTLLQVEDTVASTIPDDLVDNKVGMTLNPKTESRTYAEWKIVLDNNNFILMQDGGTSMNLKSDGDISIKNTGGEISIDASGNIVANGPTTKLGENALLGVARVNDPVSILPSNPCLIITTAPCTMGGVHTNVPITITGAKIQSGSTKVKSE